jgi:hypothetical protein
MEVHPPPNLDDFMPEIGICGVCECVPPVETSIRLIISIIRAFTKLWSTVFMHIILLLLFS